MNHTDDLVKLRITASEFYAFNKGSNNPINYIFNFLNYIKYYSPFTETTRRPEKLVSSHTVQNRWVLSSLQLFLTAQLSMQTLGNTLRLIRTLGIKF